MINCTCETEKIKIKVEQPDEEVKVRIAQFSAGGIEDYNFLTGKPTINGKQIAGDMTSSDYGVITSYEELDDIPSINGVQIKGDVSSDDIGVIKSYDELTDRPSVDGKTISGAMTSSDFGVITDYEDLSNLPSINGAEIKGNITSKDLGVIKSYEELDDRPSVDGKTISGAMTKEDFGVVTDYESLDNLPTLNGQEIKGAIVIGDLGFVLTNTMAGWSAQRNLVSKKDVFYIYSDFQAIDNGNGSITTYPGLKVGDGHTKLSQLPFMNSPDPRLLNHIANNIVHITADERAKWNKAIADLTIIQSQLQGGMHELGVTTTELTDGSIVNSLLIDGKYVTPSAGDIAKYGSKEFMYSKGGYWVELGDEALINSLIDQDGKIDESFLPAKSYDALTGTITF